MNIKLLNFERSFKFWKIFFTSIVIECISTETNKVMSCFFYEWALFCLSFPRSENNTAYFLENTFKSRDHNSNFISPHSHSTK